MNFIQDANSVRNQTKILVLSSRTYSLKENQENYKIKSKEKKLRNLQLKIEYEKIELDILFLNFRKKERKNFKLKYILTEKESS